MAAGIYSIRNKINGKQYIGSSKSIRQRWSAHRSELRAGAHHSAALQRAWDKYGEDAFEFLVLELVEDELARLARETALIAANRTADGRNGYNCLAIGGSPAGYTHTEETRRRMSEGQLKIPLEVRLSYCRSFTGREHSEETKAKMSASSPRRKLTPEERAAVSKVHKGKTIPDHVKEIVGRITAERNKTPEMRAKVSAALKGRVITPEWREKLRIAALKRHAEKSEHPNITAVPLNLPVLPVVDDGEHVPPRPVTVAGGVGVTGG
jgi:predicted GIY-YIG superfamily endonuclease